MADINPIQRTPAAAYAKAPAHGTQAGHTAPPRGIQRPQDAVNLSSDASRAATHARLLDQSRAVPEVRAELIERVKSEIEAGTYVTPDKLNHAVENLLDDL